MNRLDNIMDWLVFGLTATVLLSLIAFLLGIITGACR
jgi:hypothetical protein